MAGPAAEPGDGRPIQAANAEQLAAWDGKDGEDWLRHEERYNASVHRHGLRLRDASQILAVEDVLDIGCGCGASTRDAALAAYSGTALGVDLSSRMIERARERSQAEGITNASFEQADAQVYPFAEHSFDIAISRFGVMFFDDPVAAFRNIHRALRPGGRMALLAWQELGKNEWLTALRGALAVGRMLPEPPLGGPGPFGLADPDAVRRILTEAGFEGIDLEDVREPVYIGADAGEAYAFVCTLGITRGMLEGLDEADRTRALDAARATIEAHDSGEGVLFDSHAWLITARRP